LYGKFETRPLGSIPDMQRHIRQHGSIVCRMQLFSDIREFFMDNPLAVYEKPGGSHSSSSSSSSSSRGCLAHHPCSLLQWGHCTWGGLVI
jgi:hypothetical protein